MSIKVDDWEKPRSHGTRLTEAEIQFMREGYLSSRLYRDVARDLKCSSRIASKYYSLFAAEGVRPQNIPAVLPVRRGDSAIAPPSKARLMAGR